MGPVVLPAESARLVGRPKDKAVTNASDREERMPTVIDWLESLKDVWSGFVMEVVLDAEAAGERGAQAELLKAAAAAVQPGYALQRIVIPSEPGIDPADYDAQRWEGMLKRWAAGDHKDIMLLGSWPDDASDYFVVSLIWQEVGLFRMEFSTRYARQLAEFEGALEKTLDVVRLAWATCGGVSGWANLAMAGEPDQREEMGRLAAKWGRKSQVTLLDLTPPGKDPAPIRPALPGACWLTILSSDSVVALGGLEAVDAAIPEDVRLELFENGGVLVQLTPTPDIPEGPEVDAKYQALGELLAPLVPGSSE